MELTMRKTGAFDAPVATDFQCVVKGTPRYRYDLQICTDREKLDTHGFVLDADTLDTLFEQWFHEHPMQSCEIACCDCVELVLNTLVAQNRLPRWIKVSIVGTHNDRWMSAKWTAPQLN